MIRSKQLPSPKGSRIKAAPAVSTHKPGAQVKIDDFRRGDAAIFGFVDCLHCDKGGNSAEKQCWFVSMQQCWGSDNEGEEKTT